MPHPPLDILYRDEHLIAIDKPAGMLVHRSRIDRTASVFALQTLRNQIEQRVFPVHRLDKPTSGVLLFALDKETARLVGEQFEARSVSKTYLAVVRGYTDDAETIDYALKETPDRTTDDRARADKDAQPALTTYRTLAVAELQQAVGRYDTARYSLVEARPETGRKHQIRRHFKHIFHPVIGDRKYGDRDHNAFFQSELGIDRMLLHAFRLELEHPHEGGAIRIEAPPGGEFASALDNLGWSVAAGA